MGGVWRLVWVAWLLLVALVCPVGFSCPPVVSNGINIFSGPDRLISCFLWPSPIFGPGFEYWLISMDSLWNSSIFAFPVKVMWFSPRLFFCGIDIFSGLHCRLLFFFGLRRFLVPFRIFIDFHGFALKFVDFCVSSQIYVIFSPTLFFAASIYFLAHIAVYYFFFGLRRILAPASFLFYGLPRIRFEICWFLCSCNISVIFFPTGSDHECMQRWWDMGAQVFQSFWTHLLLQLSAIWAPKDQFSGHKKPRKHLASICFLSLAPTVWDILGPLEASRLLFLAFVVTCQSFWTHFLFQLSAIWAPKHRLAGHFGGFSNIKNRKHLVSICFLLLVLIFWNILGPLEASRPLFLALDVICQSFWAHFLFQLGCHLGTQAPNFVPSGRFSTGRNQETFGIYLFPIFGPPFLDIIGPLEASQLLFLVLVALILTFCLGQTE